MGGLGRMGGNMVQRLVEGGHELVVYDHSADAVKRTSPREPGPPRTSPTLPGSWRRDGSFGMVPAGAPVENTIERLVPHLSQGDIVIDGGNSNFRDSSGARRRSRTGIELVDVGTSGGIWGLTLGYCLMIGASKEAFEHCEPIFRTSRHPMDTPTWARRRRPLRQDGPQRNRVRIASGVCRGLRDPARLS